MSGLSTHRDSPKVPGRTWPPVKLSPQELMRLTTWDAYPAAVEEETYIPVSSLLSDEVVEAVAWFFPPSAPIEARSKAAKQLLKAVIEKVGGGQGGE